MEAINSREEKLESLKKGFTEGDWSQTLRMMTVYVIDCIRI